MLIDMTLREFGTLLASKEPAPGGGSVSALAGMMAAALGQMVVNLSVGKKAFKTLDEETQNLVKSKGLALETRQKRMEELADEDTAAFNSFIAAVRLPEGTDWEKEVRSKAIMKASDRIIEAPLETCHGCIEILEACLCVAEHGNKNAVSDVGVAAYMAFCGLEGAALNVKTNLMSVENEEKREKLKFEVEKFGIIGKGYHEKVMSIVNNRL